MLRSHAITFFTAHELCPVGKVYRAAVLRAPPADLWPNIIPTVKIAEEARKHFGEPLFVNSGYRDFVYNQAVGSTSRRHVDFFAMDVWMRGTPTWVLFDWLEEHPLAHTMGIGLYLDFIHMDTVGRQARWGGELRYKEMSG